MSELMDEEPVTPDGCLNNRCRIRSYYLKEAVEREKLEKKLSTATVAVGELFGVISNIFSYMKGNLKIKAESGVGISFNEIRQLINLSLHLPDPAILNEISSLLDEYMNNAKRHFDYDCIRELYIHEDVLPEEYQTPKPVLGDSIGLTKEKLRAIVLYEYRRLFRLEGSKFIEGRISYDDYEKQVTELTKNAGETYPK